AVGARCGRTRGGVGRRLLEDAPHLGLGTEREVDEPPDPRQVGRDLGRLEPAPVDVTEQVVLGADAVVGVLGQPAQGVLVDAHPVDGTGGGFVSRAGERPYSSDPWGEHGRRSGDGSSPSGRLDLPANRTTRGATPCVGRRRGAPMTTTEITRTGNELVDELTTWLEENWDPDLTVGEWWDRLGMAGWAAPMLPENAYGKGLTRGDAILVAGTIARFGALGAPQG